MNETLEGSIFNIQRYSTHDGAGIRTTVFVKGCPLRCFWCHNPESQPAAPVLMFSDSQCTGCGACEAVCPYAASHIVDGKAVVDRDKCAVCGSCVDVCPAKGRAVAGRPVTVDEVMEVILRDVPLYENSGGGVTISGGEPTLQPEFVAQILRRCRAEGIHTAMETCGYVRRDVLEGLLPLLDFLFMDVKAVDPEQHRRGTGVDNTRILENARLVAGKLPLCIRMPLIPGFNDDDESVAALGRFVGGELRLDARSVELLRYNNLGESKTRRMGRGQQEGLQPQSPERVAALNEILKQSIMEARK